MVGPDLASGEWVVTNHLKPEFPSQGWKQILTARTAMLDQFDRAREQGRVHKAKTFHGRVAEASCREWLKQFLPRRYGVTSGYIVSPGLKSSQETPHFDVIIYDRLESPILWVEPNPDSTEQGLSRAIPVEHVHVVLEVKASFSAHNVKESIAHLGELSLLMSGVDDPKERYKFYLPSTFVCGLLFFELRKANAKSQVALSNVINGLKLRGFLEEWCCAVKVMICPKRPGSRSCKASNPSQRFGRTPRRFSKMQSVHLFKLRNVFTWPQ